MNEEQQMQQNSYLIEMTEMKCNVRELIRKVDDLSKKQQETVQHSIDLKLLTATVLDLSVIVKELKIDVCEFKSEDGKKWKKAMGIIGGTALGAIVTYFITLIIAK